jgi:hypothetical protein
MAGGDVVDVEEYLVAALASPYLVAGVAGVAEDGPNGGLGPGAPRAVGVAGAVIAGHLYGTIGYRAPLLHLRRLGAGGVFDTFAGHFGGLWATTTPMKMAA